MSVTVFHSKVHNYQQAFFKTQPHLQQLQGYPICLSICLLLAFNIHWPLIKCTLQRVKGRDTSASLVTMVTSNVHDYEVARLQKRLWGQQRKLCLQCYYKVNRINIYIYKYIKIYRFWPSKLSVELWFITVQVCTRCDCCCWGDGDIWPLTQPSMYYITLHYIT